MASLASNGGPTQRRRRRKAKGTKSVMAKLEESLKEGDFYSALQMYKTLLSRTSPKELNNAAEIAEQGSVKLLEFGYIKAATELGKQYVNDFLVEFKVPVNQDIVSTIRRIAEKYPPKDISSQQDKLSFLLEAIDWSKKCDPLHPRGTPSLHLVASRTYIALGDFSNASTHFLFSAAPVEHAKFLLFLGKRGFKGERDLFILRVVLQFLALENIKAASTTFNAWKDSVVDVETPATHLADFLIRASQRGVGAEPLLTLLEQRYKQTIDRDDAFRHYLSILGHRLFGRPKPQMGGMMGMLSQMLGF